MKAILEFALPEETEAFDDATNGSKWKSAMLDLNEQLRSWIKHGHSFKNADEALQNVRQRLGDEVDGYNLHMD